MKTFEDAVPESFENVDGYWSFTFPDDDRYELALEPLIGGNYALALYERMPNTGYGNLMLKDKIMVKPVLRHQRP